MNGFRCDAGYMVPYPVWRYIIAKVRRAYPDTVFLLEGLGGRLDTVERLLTGAGLNWAYSELFQTYTREQIEQQVSYAFDTAAHKGMLIHYSETRDNPRLAARSAAWSRLRTALCALCSHGGGFGGHQRVAPNQVFTPARVSHAEQIKDVLHLYLPCITALVLQKTHRQATKGQSRSRK